MDMSPRLESVSDIWQFNYVLSKIYGIMWHKISICDTWNYLQMLSMVQAQELHDDIAA